MTDPNDSLSECPEPFRSNCANFESFCHRCRAAGTGKKLMYRAIDSKIEPHPAERPVDEAKSRMLKRARKSEKKVLREVGGRSTRNSGAVDGNGDGVVGDFTIEHKQRFGPTHNLGPTLNEWGKAIAQGVDFIFITSERHGTIVTMHLDTLKRILPPETLNS